MAGHQVFDRADRGAVDLAPDDHPELVGVAVRRRDCGDAFDDGLILGRVGPADDVTRPRKHVLFAVVGEAEQHSVGADGPDHAVRFLLIDQRLDAALRHVLGQHGHVRRDVGIDLEFVLELAQLAARALDEHRRIADAHRNDRARAVARLRRHLDVAGAEGFRRRGGADDKFAAGRADHQRVLGRQPLHQIDLIGRDIHLHRVVSQSLVGGLGGEVLEVARHRAVDARVLRQRQPLAEERHGGRVALFVREGAVGPLRRRVAGADHRVRQPRHDGCRDLRGRSVAGDRHPSISGMPIGPRHRAVARGALAVRRLDRARRGCGAAHIGLAVAAALVVDRDHLPRLPRRDAAAGRLFLDAKQRADVIGREDASGCRDGDPGAGRRRCVDRGRRRVAILERSTLERDHRESPGCGGQPLQLPGRIARMRDVEHVRRLHEAEREGAVVVGQVCRAVGRHHFDRRAADQLPVVQPEADIERAPFEHVGLLDVELERHQPSAV